MARCWMVVALCLLTALLPTAAAVELYVAPAGSDTAAGTRQQPFATPQRARDAIRALRAGGALPVGGVTVNLGGGHYDLAQTLELTKADSGTEQAPSS